MSRRRVICTGMGADIRSLVEKELEDQGTDLESFIAARRSEKSVREITAELNEATGIPITWRTLYRWIDAEEKAS